MDDGAEIEQRGRIDKFIRLSGIKPTFTVTSGGKSLHPHLVLTDKVEIKLRTYFSRMFAIALLGDPAVCNPHQPMRAPGFFRKEKGKLQVLDSYSGVKYSASELTQAFEKFFYSE
ncbi:hypothetical protein [Nostoc piscinale]|nr:hypothetical protein [Nostoc piscinale]